MSTWTNGEITLSSLHREGNFRENFIIKDCPPVDRQKGRGQFSPITGTLWFSLYDSLWECDQAQIEGRIIKTGGALSDKYSNNIYPTPADRDEFNTAPPWLQHVAVGRLAVLNATTGAQR